MSDYCTAVECGYRDTHNILGHKCRTCKIFGHGFRECESMNLRSHLKLNIIPQDEQCDVINCGYKMSHTRRGHSCRLCKR